jgi:hypothetical protein
LAGLIGFWVCHFEITDSFFSMVHAGAHLMHCWSALLKAAKVANMSAKKDALNGLDMMSKAMFYDIIYVILLIN